MIEERGTELAYNCSIGIIITDGTGTRKSSRFKIGAAGFLDFEKQQAEAYEAEKFGHAANKKYLQQSIKVIEKSNHFDVQEHARLGDELEQLPACAPTLTVGDVTEEGYWLVIRGV